MKTAIKFFVSVGLMVLFLYLAFRGTDFQKLWDALLQANYWWALAALPILLVSHALRAWRWEYFLKPVKPNIRYRNLFSATIIGYMMNNVLPRAGEIVRPYAIGKFEGVSRSVAFGTILVERIFDILSFLFMIALVPLVYNGPLTQAFPWLVQTGIWVTVATLGIFGMFIFFMVRRDVVEKVLNFFTRHLSERKAKLISRIAHSFLDGFLFLKEAKHYGMILLLSALLWGLYIVMMYVPFYAFGLTEKYGLDFNSAIVIHTISSIGFVVPTPGATGPYHYFVVQTMTKLYGVDENIARSYAAVTHAVGFIGITLLGTVYFFKDKLQMSEMLKEEYERNSPAAPVDVHEV